MKVRVSPEEMSEAQKIIARNMSEAELQNSVIDAAQKLGWLVHAERAAITVKGYRTPMQGDPGFPDLVISKEGHFPIFAELKSQKGKQTTEQKNWGNSMYPIYVLWRPSDWLSGEIEQILKG